MKIAVLSDIHGNVPALEEVMEDIERWRPDLVVVNGDLINRGPCSLAVLERLLGWSQPLHLLRGNHENFLLYCRDHPADPESSTFEIDRFAHWGVAQLGSALDAVAAWPDHLDLTDLEGGSLHVTHGSRLGDRSGISPEVEGEELAQKIGDARDLFIASHTHRAFSRRFGQTLVVNTGSVGQPFDHDPRASYVRLTFIGSHWQVQIIRLDYDRERAMGDFSQSGFLEAGGPFAGLIYKEFVEARIHVGPWRRRFLEAVKAREIGAVESIEKYLATL